VPTIGTFNAGYPRVVLIVGWVAGFIGTLECIDPVTIITHKRPNLCFPCSTRSRAHKTADDLTEARIWDGCMRDLTIKPRAAIPTITCCHIECKVILLTEGAWFTNRGVRIQMDIRAFCPQLICSGGDIAGSGSVPSLDGIIMAAGVSILTGRHNFSTKQCRGPRGNGGRALHSIAVHWIVFVKLPFLPDAFLHSRSSVVIFDCDAIHIFNMLEGVERAT